MDPILIGLIGCAVLIVLLALGVHIAVALGATGLIGLILIRGFDPASALATSTAYFPLAKDTLVVVPLFVFMGVLSGIGGISHDLYRVMGMWVGKFRGSMGVATVASCTAFGVVTGSSVVCSAVFSRVSAPEMRQQGFDKRLAYGICAAAGSIGMLIPPSILIIIYALFSDDSPGALLIAGVSPGLLLAVAFSAEIMLLGWLKPEMVGVYKGKVEKVPWAERLKGLVTIWPVFVVALIMIGGIYGGVFTANEAAAFGALVLAVITLFTQGKNRWGVLGKSAAESASITAMIFLILAGAGIFARFLMISGVTPAALNFILGLNLAPIAFIMVMCVLYLIMGCFLDSISMLSITLPLIIPAVRAMGINTIYFAMISILAIEIGLITPPVGLNVFAAKGVAEPDVTLEDIFRGSMMFFLAELVVLALLISFPWLSTILPQLMMNR